jgi:hypothetical protein
MGDFSHLKNKKGELVSKPLPQPTLPNISLDDDDDVSSMHTRVAAPSTYTKDYYNYQSDKGLDYPPMPAYNSSLPHQISGGYPHYNPSAASIGYDDPMYPSHHPMYDDDNESTAHLAVSAAPFAQQPIDRPGSAGMQVPYGHQTASYDPHDVYQGRAGLTPPGASSTRHSPAGSSSTVGLAYDDPYSSASSAPYGSRGRPRDEESGGGYGHYPHAT